MLFNEDFDDIVSDFYTDWKALEWCLNRFQPFVNGSQMVGNGFKRVSPK
jgi:hypothetical protein